MVDSTGGRQSRRLSSRMLVLLALSAAACAESDLLVVQVNGEAAALTITVDYLEVNQLVGSAERLVLAVGDSVSLSATALNALGLVVGQVPVTWSSSDSSVVEITDAGLVRAVASGTAEILASADEVAASLATLVTETGVVR